MTDELLKFGPIWGGSGVTNFFGQGYPYHKYWKKFGLDLRGLTRVDKTATANFNRGNMPMLGDGITPREFFPNCIYVSPRSWYYGGALNAVALSNPGIESLIFRNEWQLMEQPFFISIMAIGETVEMKLKEINFFADQICKMISARPHLKSILGIQLNLTCPSTSHSMNELIRGMVAEARSYLDILGSLGLPIVPKINVLLPPEYAAEIACHGRCSGLTLSNTIPWDDLPRFGIDRKKIFGSDISPLIKKRGFKQAGGYSGRELLPIVCKYVRELRHLGCNFHINAGGGLLYAENVDQLNDTGPNSFSMGSASFLRPRQTGPIIRRAYKLKGVKFPFDD